PAEGVPSPSRMKRSSLNFLRGTAAGSAGAATGAVGAAIPKSPSGWLGPAAPGVSGRWRRSLSGEDAESAKVVPFVRVAGTGGVSCGEPAMVVPFVRKEEKPQGSPQQQPSQEPSSQPSHTRSRSGSGSSGGQRAAGQEILFRVDLLRAPAGPAALAGETKPSGETGGEESRGQTQAASYHETLDLELVDYFGDVAQSWNVGRGCCTSVKVPLEEAAEMGEGGCENLAEGMDGEGQMESWRMCSLSSGVGVLEGDALTCTQPDARKESEEETEEGRSMRVSNSRVTNVVCL
ncbi:unnamed protein product, partial [Closterium sp. Naga37s-1]